MSGLVVAFAAMLVALLLSLLGFLTWLFFRGTTGKRITCRYLKGHILVNSPKPKECPRCGEVPDLSLHVFPGPTGKLVARATVHPREQKANSH